MPVANNSSSPLTLGGPDQEGIETFSDCLFLYETKNSEDPIKRGLKLLGLVIFAQSAKLGGPDQEGIETRSRRLTNNPPQKTRRTRSRGD